MIKDDFDQIVELLDGSDSISFNLLQENLKKVADFIQKVNQELIDTKGEDRAALLKLIYDMQRKIKTKVSAYCARKGITEDQLNEISQDTSALSPQLKQSLEHTNHEIAEMSKNITKFLGKKPETSKKKSSLESKKKNNRSQWKKS